MKYRELVVKIPEEVISFINLHGFVPEEYRNTVNHVFLDATELPSGHEKLIDADALPINAIDDAIIVEFEKLKAEIKQQGSIHIKYRRTEDIDHLVDSIVYQCKDGFCNYIDNHISELRGEQE